MHKDDNLPTVIELTNYPIYELQEDEPIEWHERFSKYYLLSAKTNLNEAYRQYLDATNINNVDENTGTIVSENTVAPRHWREAEKNYRWQERHRAYWKKICHDQREYLLHQQREVRDRMMKIINIGMQKVEEMMISPTKIQQITSYYEDDGRARTMIVMPQESRIFLDAAKMACMLMDQQEKMLPPLEKSIDEVLKHGYEVIDPSLHLTPAQENEIDEALMTNAELEGINADD